MPSVRPTLLAAALLALPLLAATPAAEAHARVDVHLGLGAVIVDPPFYGHLYLGGPPLVPVAPVGWHYHGRRLCRFDHRHEFHRHDHWRYDRY